VAGTVAYLRAFYDYEHSALKIVPEGERQYGTVGSLPVVDGERLE
jgi:hypothetical protein